MKKAHIHKKPWIFWAFVLLGSLVSLGILLSVFGNKDGSLSHGKNHKKKYTVAVSQLVDHVALNQVHQGIKAGIEESGLIIGRDVEWIYENAQGNIALTTQIAQKFVSLKPSVIVAIATPAAQAVAALKSHIPLVFAAITDPIAVKLVKSLKHPGGSITGVTDAPPVEKNIQLIRGILPRAQTLGVIYNPAEPNSLVLLEHIKQASALYGFEVHVALAPKTSEVLTALRQILDQVDAIIFPLDNTVTAVVQSLVRVASTHKIPVFSLDPSLVSQGVLASVGVSEYHGGVQAGKIVARLLKGESPGNIEITNSPKEERHLNKEKFMELGLVPPDDMKHTGP